ncbi:MAG TPA: hypothetical protein VGR28_14945 [Candidatus Thermoplasmatota archaeon]|jgi:hypothetical protein|nr:hypothetical protein [Candidatus Thermoplasmatota archaeon]
MVVAATLGVMGTGAALWPVEAVLDTGKVWLSPSVNGYTAQSCGGVAPRDLGCEVGVDALACVNGCVPRVSGTLGYTGVIKSILEGRNADGSSARAWLECSLYAGQSAKVAGNEAGYCDRYGSDAEEHCDNDPHCVIIYPPYKLRGTATPPKAANAQAGSATGTWTVSIVAT